VDAGHDVLALVRTPAKRAILPAEVEVVAGDLGIFAEPGREFPACDVVVHLAGAVNAPDRRGYEQINRDAVADLLGCLERQSWTPRRVVFASSLAAAGPSSGERPLVESDPPAPVEVYGETKRDAEALMRDAPFDTTSFRPAIVLGDGDTATLTLFKAARLGIGIRARGAPQQLSFVDVADVVSAVECMMMDERAGDWTYFVSHPREITVVDLWNAVGRAVGRRVRLVPMPHALLRGLSKVSTAFTSVTGGRNQLDTKQVEQILTPAFVCSADALRHDLGWKARVDLDESTRRAVEGYRERGWL
jgi:nucleoside-diphosphate-sugar epimerase